MGAICLAGGKQWTRSVIEVFNWGKKKSDVKSVQKCVTYVFNVFQINKQVPDGRQGFPWFMVHLRIKFGKCAFGE